MLRKTHIMLRKTHIMLRKTHIMLRKTHIMLRKTHIMLRKTHIMLRKTLWERSTFSLSERKSCKKKQTSRTLDRSMAARKARKLFAKVYAERGTVCSAKEVSPLTVFGDKVRYRALRFAHGASIQP